MAATATASSSSGVRYAPEDPTLPKPWRGLVDCKTGYLYFWNPETNVTQYERPVTASHTGSPPSYKSSSMAISSLVHVQPSSQEKHHDRRPNDDDDRYYRGSNGASKPASEAKSYSSARSGSDHFHNASNGTVGAGSLSRGLGSSGVESGVSPEAYRRKHEITVTGDNVPPPLISFQGTGFPPEILREVHQAGFSAPTPIQAQSWPIALQSRDIVAIAKTGSGKTLGYLIPGFIHLKRRRNNPQMGPTVLVLSPTRELATQIQDEALKFGKSSKISCTCLYGGAPKGPQLRELDRGTDIVVATPGRLNDILEMKRVSLHQVSYLVLDEADRMLDMGFEPQIRKIVKEVPAHRQTLMYTATWPKEVRKIAADLLVNPVQVNIGNVDELVANNSITQYVEVLTSMEKHRRLEQILRSQESGSKIIIFCSTKKMCDQLARNLTRPFGAAAIHGDKSQGERDYVLNQFRTGRSPVMVATDVAARGLDIKDIRVVINYDFPTGIEDYVHRIGRTGRAGATGLAYTFFGEQDAKYASDLVKVLEGANQRVPNELRDMASRGGGMGRLRRWGSGPSGRDGGRSGGYDLGYGGRDGGRSASGYGSNGRGSDRNSRGSDRYGSRNFNGGSDVDAPGSYHHRSFHEGMTHTGEKRRRSQSRSHSRSPKRGSRWNYSSRGDDKAQEARERSPMRTFHQSMMQRSQSPPSSGNQRWSPYSSDKTRKESSFEGKNKENIGGSYNDESKGFNSGPRSFAGEEEEEEGMIPADEGSVMP